MISDLRSLFDLTRGSMHRRRYAAALAALAVSVALGHLVPLTCGALIDAMASEAAPAAASRGNAALAALGSALAAMPWLAALLVVLLTTGSGAFAYLKGRWAAQAAEGVARDLRNRLHDHLQRLPCRHLDASDTGDLVQRCTSDVETVRLFLSAQVVEIGRALLLVGLALPAMLWLDARMTLVALALFPPIFLFATIFFRRVKHRFLAADEAEGAMTSVLQENLTGIRVVRAFSREDHERARFGVHAARFRDLQYRVVRLMALYWSLSDFVCVGQLGLVLVVGGTWAAQGQVGVGTLYAFMAWVSLLLWPVRQMGRILTDTGKAVVSLRRIREILDVPEETASDAPRPGASLPARWDGRLELRGLAFSHADGQRVLDGIDLVVEPGEAVALVGPPGCGKSTIISLLLRLHDHREGEILLDGVEIRELPRRLVRELVASVLQDPFLYSRTLETNIRVGRDDATRAEVESAAHAASIHDAIVQLPAGYDTLVGERGVTLSGGQRQRVALARALLDDAPVLVLDDALSAVDTRTEARIREALRARRGRRTTLVVAHRLATVREADRIAVLREGRIVQLGTHEELAAIEGPYRRLWSVQVELEDELQADLRSAHAGGQS